MKPKRPFCTVNPQRICFSIQNSLDSKIKWTSTDPLWLWFRSCNIPTIDSNLLRPRHLGDDTASCSKYRVDISHSTVSFHPRSVCVFDWKVIKVMCWDPVWEPKSSVWSISAAKPCIRFSLSLAFSSWWCGWAIQNLKPYSFKWNTLESLRVCEVQELASARWWGTFLLRLVLLWDQVGQIIGVQGASPLGSDFHSIPYIIMEKRFVVQVQYVPRCFLLVESESSGALPKKSCV